MSHLVSTWFRFCYVCDDGSGIAHDSGRTDMVFFSMSLPFSLLPLSIMHQICLLVSLLKPQKTLKVKESKLPMKMDKTWHHFVVPLAISTTNFRILQTDEAYQVFELPLQGINGVASPPFIVGWHLLSSRLL